MDEDDEDEDEDGGHADADSRARTYLANERTFLSWFRTGITLVALGLASAQFLTSNIVSGVPLRRTLAVGFVVGGLVVTLNGLIRYFRSNREIARERFRPADRSIVATTVIMVAVGVAAVAFILLLR